MARLTHPGQPSSHLPSLASGSLLWHVAHTQYPACRPLTRPSLQYDREMLEFFDKIFWLGAQLAMAANNLGVPGVLQALAQSDPSQTDFVDPCNGQKNDQIQGVATAAG